MWGSLCRGLSYWELGVLAAGARGGLGKAECPVLCPFLCPFAAQSHSLPFIPSLKGSKPFLKGSIGPC